MHEVSFQDKEKEHLTRLQDAEEMKVCMQPFPGAPHALGLDFLHLGKSSSFPRCVGEVGRRGAGLGLGIRAALRGWLDLEVRWTCRCPGPLRCLQTIIALHQYISLPTHEQEGESVPSSTVLASRHSLRRNSHPSFEWKGAPPLYLLKKYPQFEFSSQAQGSLFWSHFKQKWKCGKEDWEIRVLGG